MGWRMSENLHKVLLRRKEYDVYVKDEITQMTTIRFIYNKTNIYKEVFIPDDISDQKYNRILTEAVRIAIKDYNRRIRNKKC